MCSIKKKDCMRVKVLLEAAPVVEFPLHKVPLDQVNVAPARSTFAVETSAFVGVICRSCLLGILKIITKVTESHQDLTA